MHEADATYHAFTMQTNVHFRLAWLHGEKKNTDINHTAENHENLDFQNFKIDFRQNIKSALIDEFYQNQCQNEANSSYFK